MYINIYIYIYIYRQFLTFGVGPDCPVPHKEPMPRDQQPPPWGPGPSAEGPGAAGGEEGIDWVGMQIGK